MNEDKTKTDSDEEGVIEASIPEALSAAPPGTEIDTSSVENLPSVAVTSWLPTPKSFDEAMKFAEMIAGSKTVPKEYQGQPGDVLIAVQMGMDVGLSWAQALQNIAVINGKPTMYGDAVLAIVKGSGLLADIEEQTHGEWNGKLEENTFAATCTVLRKGDKRPVSHTFSIQDAAMAALYPNKPIWKQYPRRMLQMRARSWALRDKFPDVLKGIAIREEVEDYIEGEIISTGEPAKAEQSSVGARTRRERSSGAEPVNVDDLIAKIGVMQSSEAQEVANSINDLEDPEMKRKVGKLFTERMSELKGNGGKD